MPMIGPRIQNPTRFAVYATMCVTLLCFVMADSTHGRDKDYYKNRDNRFWAILSDGTVVTGREIREWQDNRRHPMIGNRKLFEKNNPVMVIIDTASKPKLDGPYVQFANGDVLTGRVVGSNPNAQITGDPQLQVAVRSPVYSWDISSAKVTVRARHVSRIVLSHKAKGPIEPGTISYVDGRRAMVKAMRWTRSGIRALTDGDVLEARWAELAEVHPPHTDVMTSLIEDLTAPCPDPDSLIGRIVTQQGSVLTHRHSMLQIDHKDKQYGGRHHVIQPAWSLDSIRIPAESIIRYSYRRADEIPLSLLPGQAISERSYTGFVWRWQRNRNVRGADLVSGRFAAQLGIGTHAASQIAFDLPPGAKQFSSWVGIDRAVGNGGCVQCFVYRDQVEGNPIWKSDFLRGGSEPVGLKNINLDKANRLVLVTDFAHEGRPKGADPLDIRDQVNWLRPMVRVDRSKLPGRTDRLVQDVPALARWQIADSVKKRTLLRPYWDKNAGKWVNAMFVDGDKQKLEQTKPFELTRKLKITAANAWLDISAARDDNGPAGHEISVKINGKPIGTIMNGNVRTHHSPGHFDKRRWSLAPFVGKQVSVAVIATPKGDKNHKPTAILWEQAGFSPIILNLPADNKPIKPQISISSLKTIHEKLGGSKYKLQAGKLIDGKPLHIRYLEFKDGYGVPGNSEIRYKLDPKWTRFVAVIGLAEGTSIGPYRIMLDDKQVWPDIKGKDRKQQREDEKAIAVFDRHSAARQIDLVIPPGHKTISLHAAGRRNDTGAWANAGFMKD